MRQNSNLKTMGVINLTPDSFSDGGKFQNYHSFKKDFIQMLTWADIIDLGAESTAPFNTAIEQLDEFTRFEKYLFPLLRDTKDPGTTLSIDTYKPEVFLEVYHVIKFFWPKTNIIFNDVSGKIDDDLMNLLSMSELDFDYVYAHNLCPSRLLTSNHMEYCSTNETDDYVDEVSRYFLNGLELLKPLHRKLWLDPCFGFSKTRKQNHILLKNIHQLIKMLPGSSFIYGISRKSFLRFPPSMDAKKPENQIILDQIQTVFISDLLRFNHKNEMVFRMHSPDSLKSALNCVSILS